MLTLIQYIREAIKAVVFKCDYWYDKNSYLLSISTDSALATIPNNSENHASNRPNPVTASGSSSSLTGAIEKRETTPGPSHQSNVPSNNSSVLNNSGKSSTAVTSSISTR